jgi:hypothetical protein
MYDMTKINWFSHQKQKTSLSNRKVKIEKWIRLSLKYKFVYVGNSVFMCFKGKMIIDYWDSKGVLHRGCS